jgi:hypothetical protein
MVRALIVALVATIAVLLTAGTGAGVNTNRAIGRSALFLLSAETLITAGILQLLVGVALFVMGKR